MDSKQIREKYLHFFEERGHKVIKPNKLVLDDPTTLFTSSGMQPLVPYLIGEPHPDGKRVIDIQRVFRSQDIEEVGDNRHDTFFEMLGNWSFGDYFKKEQLPWVFEFLTDQVGIDPNRLYVTVFAGDDHYNLPKDTTAAKIWKELYQKKGIDPEEVVLDTMQIAEEKGMQNGRIFYYGMKKNWWSRFEPVDMPEGEPGGPSSELFYEFPDVIHDPKYGQECHPNCDCGRYIEIGNSVFMQYKKQGEGFVELPNKNVDFGGGLERILMAANDQPDMFKNDLHWPIIQAIEEYSGADYSDPDQRIAMRIIADHIKAAAFIILDGVVPANKLQGYVLRRLLRRSAVKMRTLTGEVNLNAGFGKTVQEVGNIYELSNDQVNQVISVIDEEITKFGKTLDKGLKEFEKGIESKEGINPLFAFNLYQTYGFPLEITIELREQRGHVFTQEELQELEEIKKYHSETSRKLSAGFFKGGLASHGEIETKYHTATHLLHQALRTVLGDHVIQRGSNITAERLRFDFAHPTKMTPEEIHKVGAIVNQEIHNNLPVKKEELPKEEALKTGAIGAFGEKYGERVTVYSIGNFSKEFCGGPHVENTGVLGNFKITKEESASAGIRRIYATLE